MNTYRSNAIIAGVLYIIGTVAGILSLVLSAPVRDAQDSLASVAANANQVIVATLFVLLMGLSLAMVSVVLYPILRKQNEVLALGYVVFRGALETVTYFVTAIGWLLLLALSQLVRSGWRPCCVQFSGFGRTVAESWRSHLPDRDRFLSGRLDVLCGVVSIKTRSSLDFRVGTRGAHSVPGRRIPGAVRPP